MTTHTNLTTASPAELARLIEEGFGFITRKKAQLLHAIALFDALRLAPRFGARTTATWLIRALSVPQSSAHEYVAVARKLREFPRLCESFLAGRINYSKVRLLIQVLREENETQLIDLAEKMHYHELELALMKYRVQNEALRRTSYVRTRTDRTGRVKLWASFNPAEGARVLAALKVGELAFNGIDLGTLRGADGEVNEKALSAATDNAPRRFASSFGLPLAEEMVTAFMGLVNMGLSIAPNPLRSPGANVNVVMTTDGRAYLPHNPGAPSEAVKNFLSNAQFRVNTVDENGLVLNTGRSSRFATDAQVNALLLMWRGTCAMPGCTHSRFIEMHHVHDWADGGPTDLDNLLPLCSACHSLVSDGVVTILKEEGDYHFLFPGGVRYISYGRGLAQRCDNARTLKEFSREELRPECAGA